MGQQISLHKYELSLVGLGLSWGLFLKWQNDRKEQLAQLSQLINPQMLSIIKNQVQIPEQINQRTICQKLVKYKQFPIFRVALTGGPCAGKSTALDIIKKHFTQQGFQVFTVPQVPTIVGQGGGMKDFAIYSSRDVISFQTGLIKFKMYIEDYFTKIAQMNKQPTLIICDRGTADCSAYMTTQEYQNVLDEQAWTWFDIRNRRYDSVIFMDTAAEGAEQFYTLANNQVRHETPQQARALNKKTLNAWIGHPYMTICPNVPGKPFQYKMDLAKKAVQKSIGLESTDIIYHKFLISKVYFPPQLTKVQSQIEEVYLKNDNPRYLQDKIKKRGQGNSHTYVRKYVAPYNPDIPFRQVIRISLNALQYVTLKTNKADPHFRQVNITRTNFCINNTYFSLDQIDYQQTGLIRPLILRFETSKDRDPLELIPSWIEVQQNVLKNKNFAMSTIARIKQAQ